MIINPQAVEDGGFEGSWEAFFEQWCKGEVAFGAWLDHLLSWCGGPAAAVRGFSYMYIYTGISIDVFDE